MTNTRADSSALHGPISPNLTADTITIYNIALNPDFLGKAAGQFHRFLTGKTKLSIDSQVITYRKS